MYEIFNFYQNPSSYKYHMKFDYFYLFKRGLGNMGWAGRYVEQRLCHKYKIQKMT